MRFGQADFAEHFFGSLPDTGNFRFTKVHRKRYVIERCFIIQQFIFLENESDASVPKLRLPSVAQLSHVFVLEKILARVVCVQQAKQIQQRRLP